MRRCVRWHISYKAQTVVVKYLSGDKHHPLPCRLKQTTTCVNARMIEIRFSLFGYFP